jgi:predicted site-specific integrase-resolvase
MIIVTIEIEGQTYYMTSEACKKAGISRATLYRWLKAGILKKYCKDRRGWRLFTQADIDKIRAEAREIKISGSFQGE